MTVAEVVAPRSMVLVDERETLLRATWHDRDQIVVVSQWRDGACRSTFQLARADVAPLTSFLVNVLGDVGRRVPEPERSQPATTFLDRAHRRLTALGRAWRTPV